MAAVSAFNHVAINVRDLERSLVFYEQGLGLRKTLVKAVGKDSWKLLRLPPGSGGQSAFLQGADRASGQVELVKWNLPLPEGSMPKRAGDPGPWVLSFNVASDQIEGVYDRLKSAGFECYSTPQSNTIDNYGVVTMFICEDPDGNQIEIVSLPSREEVKAFRAAQAARDQQAG